MINLVRQPSIAVNEANRAYWELIGTRKKDIDYWRQKLTTSVPEVLAMYSAQSFVTGGLGDAFDLYMSGNVAVGRALCLKLIELASAVLEAERFQHIYHGLRYPEDNETEEEVMERHLQKRSTLTSAQIEIEKASGRRLLLNTIGFCRWMAFDDFPEDVFREMTRNAEVSFLREESLESFTRAELFTMYALCGDLDSVLKYPAPSELRDVDPQDERTEGMRLDQIFTLDLLAEYFTGNMSVEEELLRRWQRWYSHAIYWRERDWDMVWWEHVYWVFYALRYIDNETRFSRLVPELRGY